MLLLAQQIARGASIVAVRVWPAADYSRVTIESDRALVAKQFSCPRRRAGGGYRRPGSRSIAARAGGQVQPTTPTSPAYAWAKHPGVVRLVVDLKQAARPQVFTLAPVAAYQHRLVFDLYPPRPPTRWRH